MKTGGLLLLGVFTIIALVSLGPTFVRFWSGTWFTFPDGSQAWVSLQCMSSSCANAPSEAGSLAAVEDPVAKAAMEGYLARTLGNDLGTSSVHRISAAAIAEFEKAAFCPYLMESTPSFVGSIRIGEEPLVIFDGYSDTDPLHDLFVQDPSNGSTERLAPCTSHDRTHAEMLFREVFG